MTDDGDAGLTGAAIADRLRLALGVPSDGALARAVGVRPVTVSSWRIRDSRPYALCIQVARERGLALDWLLTGRGPMRAGAADQVAEPAVAYGPGPADEGDPRLDALWRAVLDWWARASPDERVWLDVQTRQMLQHQTAKSEIFHFLFGSD